MLLVTKEKTRFAKKKKKQNKKRRRGEGLKIVNFIQTSKRFISIRVITKLPNSEQSYKGKVKTHNYINRQNQSTTGKL
jgi:hypothetical protein